MTYFVRNFVTSYENTPYDSFCENDNKNLVLSSTNCIKNRKTYMNRKGQNFEISPKNVFFIILFLTVFRYYRNSKCVVMISLTLNCKWKEFTSSEVKRASAKLLISFLNESKILSAAFDMLKHMLLHFNIKRN